MQISLPRSLEVRLKLGSDAKVPVLRVYHAKLEANMISNGLARSRLHPSSEIPIFEVINFKNSCVDTDIMNFHGTPWFLPQRITASMPEWSKGSDSSSDKRQLARVQIPLLARITFRFCSVIRPSAVMPRWALTILIVIIACMVGKPKARGHRAYTQGVCSHT